jgi:hypothetical protein
MSFAEEDGDDEEESKTKTEEAAATGRTDNEEENQPSGSSKRLDMTRQTQSDIEGSHGILRKCAFSKKKLYF